MNRYLTKEDTQMANKHMKRCCTSYTIESESEVTQSCPTLCDPMDLANQVLLSMGFPRQEYWSGLSIPSPEDFPKPGIEPDLQHCGQMLYHLSHQGITYH